MNQGSTKETKGHDTDSVTNSAGSLPNLNLPKQDKCPAASQFKRLGTEDDLSDESDSGTPPQEIVDTEMNPEGCKNQSPPTYSNTDD